MGNERFMDLWLPGNTGKQDRSRSIIPPLETKNNGTRFLALPARLSWQVNKVTGDTAVGPLSITCHLDDPFPRDRLSYANEPRAWFAVASLRRERYPAGVSSCFCLSGRPTDGESNARKKWKLFSPPDLLDISHETSAEHPI
jgi:hypothetical protein